MLFDKSFVKSALTNVEILCDHFPAELSVSFDTRTLATGDFFVALKGAHVDGHSYVETALEKGACGFMIERSQVNVLKKLNDKQLAQKLVLVVPDTLQALGDLAKAWRAQFAYPVIGVTGSVGKTSTKELICHVLEAAGIHYVANQGNKNSLLGLPLSIFSMRPTHQVAVFEMGIGKRGEMARLADIARPTIACITAVGHSHMEGLGSLQDIAHEKREIFKYFTEHSIGVVNGDQPLLGGVGYSHPVVRFGSKTTNQIQARKIRMGNDCTDFVLKIYQKKYQVRLPIAHEGMVFNALAATAVACLLDINHERIVAGIQQPLIVNGRYQPMPIANGKTLIINDCYNASPESMKAAIHALENIKTRATKIAVFGDMLELGVDSPLWHRQLGRFLRKAPSIKEVVLIGTQVQHTQPMIPMGVQVKHFASAVEALPYIQQRVAQEETVLLLKASRGMRLEQIINGLSGEQPFAGAVRAEQNAQMITPAKRPTTVP